MRGSTPRSDGESTRTKRQTRTTETKARSRSTQASRRGGAEQGETKSVDTSQIREMTYGSKACTVERILREWHKAIKRATTWQRQPGTTSIPRSSDLIEGRGGGGLEQFGCPSGTRLEEPNRYACLRIDQSCHRPQEPGAMSRMGAAVGIGIGGADSLGPEDRGTRPAIKH